MDRFRGFCKVQFDLGVLKDIGVEKDQIFLIAEKLAKLKTEGIASLISTSKAVSERYTNISDLGSRLDDVENIKNRLNENTSENDESVY